MRMKVLFIFLLTALLRGVFGFLLLEGNYLNNLVISDEKKLVDALISLPKWIKDAGLLQFFLCYGP